MNGKKPNTTLKKVNEQEKKKVPEKNQENIENCFK